MSALTNFPILEHRARVGAVVLGSIGLVVGFIGPVILDPSAAQGPLAGLFVTGPLGAILGTLLGVICTLVNLQPTTFRWVVGGTGLAFGVVLAWLFRA